MGPTPRRYALGGGARLGLHCRSLQGAVALRAGLSPLGRLFRSSEGGGLYPVVNARVLVRPGLVFHLAAAGLGHG